MSDYFESRYNYSPPSPERGSDDDEDEKESRAKRLGKVAGQSTPDKEATESNPKQRRPSSLNVLFKRDSGRENEPTREPKDATPDHNEKSAEPESAPEEDKKVPIEELKRTAIRDQAEANLPDAQKALEEASEGSPEQTEAEALIALEEGVIAKAEDPDMEADEIIEAEFYRRLAELGDEALEEPDTTLPEELPPLVIGHEEASDSAEESPEIHAVESITSEPEDSSEATPPVIPVVPPTPPPRPPKSPRSRGASSGGGGTIGGGSVNSAAPTTPILERFPAPAEEEQPRPRNHAGAAFLLGAILGNRFGRRRAERKADATLERETSKLQDELDKTKQHLEAREKDLKFAVAEKHQRSSQKEQSPQAFPFAEKASSSVESTQPPVRKPVSEILKQTVETSVQPAKAEKPKRAQPSQAEIKRVETTPTPQLLQEAETLFVGGNSVRSLYETNQIDRKGLVEIIQTALRGGNIKDVLEKVELGRERQLERAREFRHDPALGLSATDNSSRPQPIVNSDHSTSLALPNTPDASLLQPLGASPAAAQAQDDATPYSSDVPQLEPIDLTKLQRSGTPATTMIGLIVAGVVIILILFLFSL